MSILSWFWFEVNSRGLPELDKGLFLVNFNWSMLAYCSVELSDRTASWMLSLWYTRLEGNFLYHCFMHSPSIVVVNLYSTCPLVAANHSAFSSSVWEWRSMMSWRFRIRRYTIGIPNRVFPWENGVNKDWSKWVSPSVETVKTEALSYIKVHNIRAEHRPKFCISSPALVTSQYEQTTFGQDIIQKKINTAMAQCR